MDEATGDAERLDAADRWFAVNLRAARERAKLSQGQVAERMREAGYKFHQQTVGAIEAGGRRVLGVGEMQALSRITRASLDDLVAPPRVMRDASVLKGATHRLRTLRDDVREATRQEAEAVTRLEEVVARLSAAGDAEALRAALEDAERALKET
jgi:transcriptional regulator with XRE-family HTH domain